MLERARFDFLTSRDGLAVAIAFEYDLIKTYRRVVLQRNKMTMYRRQLIEHYIEAKKIVERER